MDKYWFIRFPHIDDPQNVVYVRSRDHLNTHWLNSFIKQDAHRFSTFVEAAFAAWESIGPQSCRATEIVMSEEDREKVVKRWLPFGTPDMVSLLFESGIADE